MLKNRKNKLLFLVIFLSIFVLIFILNRLYPIFADDWIYAHIYECDNRHTPRIHNFIDIIFSQYNHYLYWGGRSVLHAIDQILLSLPTIWGDLLNSLAFILLLFIIYKIANVSKSLNPFVYLLSFLVLWLSQPVISSVIFWITASAIYMWCALLILLFLCPYCLYYLKNSWNKDNNRFKIILLFLFGILAGWSNENMSVTTIFFLISLFILLRYQKRVIPKWAWSGLIGVIFGCIILLVAPGNFNRMVLEGSGLSASDHTTKVLFDVYLYRITELVKNLKYMIFPTILYLFLFIYIKKQAKGSYKENKQLLLSLLFFISAYISHLIMIAAPYYLVRVMFGTMVLLVTAIAILYTQLEFSKKLYKTINVIVLLVLSFMFSLSYIYEYKYLSKIDQFWKKREQFVESQKKKGILDIVFEDRFTMKREHFAIWEFEDFTDNWTNVEYARYYGVNSVRIMTEKEHEEFLKNKKEPK